MSVNTITYNYDLLDASVSSGITINPSLYREMLVKVMEYIDQNEGLSVLLLKHDDLREWWATEQHEIAERKFRDRALKKAKEVLTKEELRVLAIHLKVNGNMIV